MKKVFSSITLAFVLAGLQFGSELLFKFIEIIQLYYDVLVAKHGERWKMMELVTTNY